MRFNLFSQVIWLYTPGASRPFCAFSKTIWFLCKPLFSLPPKPSTQWTSQDSSKILPFCLANLHGKEWSPARSSPVLTRGYVLQNWHAGDDVTELGDLALPPASVYGNLLDGPSALHQNLSHVSVHTGPGINHSYMSVLGKLVHKHHCPTHEIT